MQAVVQPSVPVAVDSATEVAVRIQGFLGLSVGLLAVLGCRLPAPAAAPMTCEDTKLCEGDVYSVRYHGDLDEIGQCADIAGKLNISSQDWLTSLDMPCLESVAGALHIDCNDHPRLTAVNMPRLSTVAGSLSIQRNDALTTIDMSSLTSVGGILHINYNDSLTDLRGLPSLTTVVAGLEIKGNDCLSQAEAEAFAASLDVQGFVGVSGNGGDFPCD